MMNSRPLVFANTLGCLLLAALAFVQWRRELNLTRERGTLQEQLVEVRRERSDEQARGDALRRDVGLLKESVALAQQAAERHAGELAAKEQTAQRLQGELDAARLQVEAWEEALQSRDARITTLQGELAAARKRLDEAVERLKSIPAR